MARKTTPGGIVRPKNPTFRTFDGAREYARRLNEKNGRGHRALRTAEGDGFAVIFRPTVASNRQRRVREVA